MHGFKKTKSIWFHRRLFLCGILITNLAVQGFPAKASKVIYKKDGSQTVKLLRELPPLEDCNPYLARIDNLKRMKENPVLTDSIQKANYLIKQAELGKRDAIENAKKAAIDNMKNVVEGLVKEKLPKLGNFKSIIEKQKKLLIAKQGLLSPTQWRSMSNKLNKLLQDTDDLKGNIEKIEKGFNFVERRVDRHQEVQQQINETKSRCTSMQETLAGLNRDFVESGIALDIAKDLASGLGPMGPILVQLANLSIEVSVYALEGFIISNRDLPIYRENLGIMLFQKLNIDMEIEKAENKLRECLKRAQDRQKLIDEEKALQAKKIPPPATSPPPPVKTPPPPVEKTPPAGIKKGGGGIILGLLGVGVAAGAVYYGVTYLGGAKLCCETAEDWRWCPINKTCCPEGYGHFSPSTSSCWSLSAITFGSGPRDTETCRPGGWCK